MDAAFMQYGALGAIALCAIYGVQYIVKGMRQDMHDMVQANAKGNKEFTDFLKLQVRAMTETNNSFVEAINVNTAAISELAGNREDIIANRAAIQANTKAINRLYEKSMP